MAISGSPSLRKPKGPVTISLAALDTQIVVADYLGAGRTASFIKNEASDVDDLIVLRINNMTRNHRPHADYPGRVEQTVRVWDTSTGGSFTISGGGGITPTGLSIDSFQITTNDGDFPVSVTIW